MKIRNLLFGLLIIAAFGVGVLSVVLTGDDVIADTPTPTTPPAGPTAVRRPTPDFSKQWTTILVLGIDDLQAELPELGAVWMVRFNREERVVDLVGFPLSHPIGSPGSSSLQETFTWTAGEGINPAFVEALTGATQVEVDALVVMDEEFFAGLVDYLGGVFVDVGRLDGESAVALQKMLMDDPRALVNAQARVLEALRFNVSMLGSTPDLSPLLVMIPQHVSLSVPTEQLVLLVSPLLPLEPDRVNISVVPANDYGPSSSGG